MVSPRHGRVQASLVQEYPALQPEPVEQAQDPDWQDWPAGQSVLHAQRPAVQDWPAAQVMPQPPQLAASVERTASQALTSSPSQLARVAAHAATAQDWAAVRRLPAHA